MIDRIIEFSARHRWLVLALVTFATLYGWRSMKTVKLDAIPDLSDPQVIVYAKWDRSPEIIEDQLAYPVATALLGLPRVKDIRAYSDFGFSYIYVVFEEGTDLYWARSRTLEYLNTVASRLPQGATVEMSKDATSVGWIYQYALVDESGQMGLDELRSLQDWKLRYALQAVPGVAEVAPIGGFVREYQVAIDPDKLLAFRLSATQISEAVGKANSESGERLIERSGREYMLRGRGYLRSLDDLRNVVIRADDKTGTPVRLRDVARVSYGPALRRGIGELNGSGEAVGAVVVQRQGENAEKTIGLVKERIKEIEPTLPPGVKIVATYDRSELINRAMENLRHTLMEELIIVSLVILVFLWSIPSAAIPIITIPVCVMLAFIPIKLSGMTANIMSLGGLAVAIGAMVDAAIVVVEQTHKKLEYWEASGRVGNPRRLIIDAVKEVGGPSFFALLVIAVSFLPVFALEAQEGRLFQPLAFTKNFAMAIAALLAITLDPALRLILTRVDPFRFRPQWLSRIGTSLFAPKPRPEEEHFISRPLMKVYEPVVRFTLEHRALTILCALVLMATTIPVFNRLGSEFMPPLDEGTLLYMPTTMPGISIGEATRLLGEQDRILRSFPEVEIVFGKAGRIESATDPAPLSMMETTIVLKPQSEWPRTSRWWSGHAPHWAETALRHLWPDHMSTEELIHGPSGMNEALTMPGVANAWTMPIKGRIDMLSSGIRTPVGIKILGPDLTEIERIGGEVEASLRGMPGLASVYAERTTGGYYLDFELKRDQLARYGLNVDEAQQALMTAVGGETSTTTVEGRERYAVNLRYLRDYRSTPEELGRVLIPTPAGAQIPLRQIATIMLRSGPGMIRDENGVLSGYVFVDVSGRDIGSFVADAQHRVASRIKLPVGYRLQWSGQYESMLRVRDRLKMVLPITILLVFLLLYANTGSTTKSAIILLAAPFSAIGAIWLLHWLGYNMSVAVWVGLIALLGVDAETAMFMLLYLDLSYKEACGAGRMNSWKDLREAAVHGAVKRLRPKLMTVACMLMGLLPILLSNGTGSDVMKRIAAPMVGGIVSSFLMELIVYPPIFAIWKWRTEVKSAISALKPQLPIEPNTEGETA